MVRSQQMELEAVVADYVSRYGFSEKARAYFMRLRNEQSGDVLLFPTHALRDTENPQEPSEGDIR